MFSERLKKKREEKDLTQIELAKRIGITRDLYNKYERAGVRPSQETLVLLAETLGTTTDYLLGKSDNPEPMNSPKNEEIAQEIRELFEEKDGLYFHFAKDAKELGLEKEDMDFILGIYKRYKR